MKIFTSLKAGKYSSMAQNEPTNDQLFIQTGGQKLEGWLTSRVVRGVELCPSFFEISLTEKFPNSFSTAIVVPGNTCKVYLGNDLILTGFIDQYQPSYDARTHFVKISGRSNVEDVVDSSYIGPPWVYNGGSLKQVVGGILDKAFPNTPVHLGKVDDAEIPTQPGIHITPGETVYSVIEEMARQTSRLLWDDESGNLVLTEVGTDRAGSALVEGKNIETGAVLKDYSQRYHRIEIRSIGSAFEPGTDQNRRAEGSAEDPQIRQDRVKWIIINGWFGEEQEKAQQRAQWEINRRKGRSTIVQVSVTGWRDAKGKLWKPNTVANVNMPTLKVEDKEMVIAQCSWERDEAGTRTVLTLMEREALIPAPFISQLGLGQG